jgi:hypothetical protein
MVNLHLPTEEMWRGEGSNSWRYPEVQRRKLKLKASIESGSSYCSFKSLVPGAFNMGLIGSTCTALPRGAVTLLCNLEGFLLVKL